MDLEPSFLEYIVDDLYSEMFEKDGGEEELPEDAPGEDKEVPEEDN